MGREIFKLGKHFVTDHTDIVDMGCSNGRAALPFAHSCPNNRLLLYDVSEPMLEACRKEYEAKPNVHVDYHDLRKGLPTGINASLVLSVLTLQFTPIEYRQLILKSVYDAIIPGGAFIIVEKVLGSTFDVDSMLVDEYYAMKKEHQYSREQIQRKRKSLEGVLVPVTASWNEELLRNAGFRQIDCFWRYLNFAGWVAVK